MLAKNGGIFSPISRLFLRTNNYDLFHIKPFINVGDAALSSEGSSLKRLIIKQHRNNEFIWSEEGGGRREALLPASRTRARPAV